MSRYLLDTDTITLIQFGHAAAAVRRLSAEPDADVALSAVSFQEQMPGWLSRLHKLTTPALLADWYDRLVTRLFPVWCRFQLLPFSLAAIQRFEQLRTLRLKVGLMDLRLAAVALEIGMTVVTRNLRDFARVPGLNSEDWSV
jgi:tRNA(fMet)-specific endonuclease VapC